MKFGLGAITGFILVALTSVSAAGQDATTYTYGDWLVSCEDRANEASCDMSQRIIDEDSQALIVRISLAFLLADEAYFMQILVPLGVRLAAGMAIQAGDTTIENLGYSRCLTQGCLVELQLESAAYDAFVAGNQGRLILMNSAGTQVSVSFSLNGFAAASQRLESETRLLTQTAD